MYTPLAQNNVVPVQYFRDPEIEHDKFVLFGTWLSGANNERVTDSSALARERIIALERFVLIRFSDDQVVVPGGSEWFGRLHGLQLEPLEEQQDLWVDDVLGLRALNETGRLEFLVLPGGHLEFPSKAWFAENIARHYLK